MCSHSEYLQKSKQGDLADDLNPIFLYSTTRTELLVAVMSGEIDPVKLAEQELRKRGLDDNGRWIGFK